MERWLTAPGETRKIGVRELRGRLSDCLRQVQAGARFTIVSRGTPIAELGLPAETSSTPQPRRSGRLAGKIRMADDWDVWPDEILTGFDKPL